MSGTNTTPKKRSFGFDDILSILDGKKTRPPARPALPPSTMPESEATPAVESHEQPPKVIALPEDHNLVPKLLSDIDQKNAEIIRLNNDLAGFKYELREKDFKINSLTLESAGKDLRIKELQTAIDRLNAEVTRLKVIQPQQPIIFTPAQQQQQQQQQQQPASADQPAHQAAQPIQLTNLLDAVQSEKAAQIQQQQEHHHHQQQQSEETSGPVQADAAGARPIKEQYSIKEDVVEEDVATIFKRLARASRDEEEPAAEGGNAGEAPRRPRSAKLYDL